MFANYGWKRQDDIYFKLSRKKAAEKLPGDIKAVHHLFKISHFTLFLIKTFPLTQIEFVNVITN